MNYIRNQKIFYLMWLVSLVLFSFPIESVLNLYIAVVLVGIVSFFGVWAFGFPSKKSNYRGNIQLSLTTILVIILWGFFLFKTAEAKEMEKTESLKARIKVEKTLSELLFESVNDYRVENNKNIFISDDELCDIASRMVASPNLMKVGLDREDYEDLCSNCNLVSKSVAKDMSSAYAIITAWENDTTTKNNLLADHTFACIVEKGSAVVLFSASKTSNKQDIKTTNYESYSNSNKAVHCSIADSCGGGTIPLTQAECNNSVCCQMEDGSWEFYKDKNKCNKDQGEGQSGMPSSSTASKVQFTTTEAIVDGTYYCYEDKINELTRIERDIKFKTAAIGACAYEPGTCSGKCIEEQSGTDGFSSCIDACNDSYAVCYKQSAEIGNLRFEYESMLRKYCP